MRRKFGLVLSMLALLGLVPLLSACHTTAGAGRDISATGHTITHSANEHSP